MDRKDIRKRDMLGPLDRAVSDTLDEYLSRIHGVFTSWAHPLDFLCWLQDRGYDVVKTLDTEDNRD